MRKKSKTIKKKIVLENIMVDEEYPRLIGEMKKDDSGKKYFYPDIYIKWLYGPKFLVKKYSEEKVNADLRGKLRKITSPYVIANDVIEVHSRLQQVKKYFEETEDDKFLIMAFVFAYANKLYPPVWVMDRLATLFTDWVDHGGVKSLDKIFSFKGRGKGKKNPLKIMEMNERDMEACLYVFFLNKICRISLDIAFYAVAARYATNKDEVEDEDNKNQTYDYKYQKGLAPKNIKDKYYKKWRKIFESPVFRTKIPKLTEEGKKKILESFPSHYLSDKGGYRYKKR